jgi:hypothetical protein
MRPGGCPGGMTAFVIVLSTRQLQLTLRQLTQGLRTKLSGQEHNLLKLQLMNITREYICIDNSGQFEDLSARFFPINSAEILIHEVKRSES